MNRLGSPLCERVIRTRFNRGVISAGLSPSTLGPNHPPSAALFPSLPWLPHEIVPEVVFSDDRSLFAKSLASLDYILKTNCQGSWSGGGAPQGLKIKGFHLTYSPTGPQYQSGFWPSFIGCSEFTTSGFTMTGVPLVMGDAPAEPLQKFQATLRGLHRSVLRHQPSFLLTLRLLLVYAVSIVFFVFGAMPPREQWLSSSQVLVHLIILSCLGIRQSLPLKVLYGGASTPGFFTPLLYERSKLRFIKGMFGCVNSRSALARGMTSHLVQSTLLRPMHGDWDYAREWMQEYGLQIVPVTSPLLSPAPMVEVVLRPVQGLIIVVTHGSQEEKAHGWAVVVIDSVGFVACAHSGALLWYGSSWAAEWCAKGLALWLLQHLSIAPDVVCGIIANNLAASFGATGGSPLYCVRVDAIRHQYASYLAHGHIPELYVPAQHDTHRQDLVASWQAEADRLAKAGLSLA